MSAQKVFFVMSGVLVLIATNGIASEYANFNFLIDGQVIYSKSGEGWKDWGQITSPVSAGAHTFRWEYSSDRTGNAYLDAIRFPPIVNP